MRRKLRLYSTLNKLDLNPASGIEGGNQKVSLKKGCAINVLKISNNPKQIYFPFKILLERISCLSALCVTITESKTRECEVFCFRIYLYRAIRTSSFSVLDLA